MSTLGKRRKKMSGEGFLFKMWTGILVLISLLWVFLVRWVFSVWANLRLDELIYELTAPLEGTSSDLVVDGLVCVLGPTVVGVGIYALIVYFLLKHNPLKLKRFLTACIMGMGMLFLLTTNYAWQRLEVGKYIKGTLIKSTFIEERYVDANNVDLKFPEEKRNLIYIFLESMETTFMDQASGGSFENNRIGELTALAKEGEDFSGLNDTVNGAHMLSGTTWTMGAMFAHTSGLPLKIGINANSMNSQAHFFSNMTSLGDILEQNGYNQTLLIGSDAVFGGRKLYFTEHGGYEIRDYCHAVMLDRIPASYYVWWGYEDFKLFEYAREELLRLSKEEKPFNLTMLTVDTHFEDGYVCEYCQKDFDKDQYSNVLACSSRQVDEFIKWVQQQDFYEDTAIVLVGDHLTMDADYCKDIDYEDRRVYTSFMNSAVECETGKRREYSTFDFFPTTLAALGVEIEGNRLGLGTNLFSQEPTLVEQYGTEHINEEIVKRPIFMEDLGQIQQFPCEATVLIENGEKTGTIDVKVMDIAGINREVELVEIEIEDQQNHIQTIPMTIQNDRSFLATIDIFDFDRDYGRLTVYATDDSGKRYQVKTLEGNLKIMARADIDAYLTQLTELEDCTIMILAADEASSAIGDVTQANLMRLGLQTDWTDKFRYSYYALINEGNIVEEIGEDVLGYKSILPDGAQAVLKSAGYLTGTGACYANIDGVNYAQNQRGLNFVVYDHVLHQVVDTSVFDTCLGKQGAEMSIDAVNSREIQVKLYNVKTKYPVEKMYVKYWKQDQLNQVYREEIPLSEMEGLYSQKIRVPKSLLGNGYMVAYAVDTQNQEIRLAEMGL